MPPESTPLDATGIARRNFSTVRKGYDPAEVRAFLHELSETIARLQRGEAHQLDRAERAEARAQLAEQLDEHRLVELLGAETARVLEAAREAATDIRSKAEESAARMIREAQGEAHAVMEQAERDGAARKREIVSEADQMRYDAEAILERRRVEGQELVDDMRRAAEAERERMVAEGERARAAAETDAERVRDMAREEGRQLVGEAEAVRERMLGDLARRRRTAREQLERLNAARERLLAAYEVVRRTVDEATGELSVALPQAKLASESAARRVNDEPEPSVEELEAELTVARLAGLVDDLDTLGDMDVDRIDSLIAGGPEAADRLLADEAGHARPAAGAEPSERKSIWPFRRRSAEDHSGSPPSTAAAVRVIEPPLELGDATEDGDDATDGGGLAAVVEPVADDDHADEVHIDDRADEGRAGDDQGGGGHADDPHADELHADVVHIDGRAHEGRADDPHAGATDGEHGGGDDTDHVDELFARLRADNDVPAARAPRADAGGALGVGATAVAVIDEPAGSEPRAAGPEDRPVALPDDSGEDDADGEAEGLDPDATVLHERDSQLGPVERDLGRRLKRVLADEQNEVFDLLRRDEPGGLDDVMPAAAEHVRRYARAALADLDAAAVSGAASVDREVTGSCSALAAELGESLVEPMRERIARSFDECEGDLEEVTERLRSLYREWKGQRIGAAVRHYAAAAYAWGVYEATPPDAELRWLVDRTGEACPDADDNALASGVRKGEVFPTGVLCSPAHPDCRCLVVPVGGGPVSTGAD